MISLLKLIFTKRWPFSCLLFCVLACHTKKEKESYPKTNSIIEEQKATIGFEQIQNEKDSIESGDLILRTGKDFTSELMRHLSKTDKTYSHCGIASWENDSLFIYHALGGEWNPDQKLRRDLFELFCNPYENRGFGIFRYHINGVQQKNIIAAARYFYKQGIMFDMQFDLATDNRMYCSEFVYKAIEKATRDSVELSITTRNNIKFIAVDNLFDNSFCSEIKRVIFK